MAGEPLITICGSAGADAELKFLASGVALCTWSMAVTPRVKQGDTWVDGETVWYRCQAWRQFGEQVCESVKRGMRLLVHGRLVVRTYEHNGEKRTSLEIDVEHVGAEMRYAVVSAKKAERSGGGSFSPPVGGGGDPWAGTSEEPPPF